MPEQTKKPPKVEIIKCSDSEAEEIEREAGYLVRAIPDKPQVLTLKQAQSIAMSACAGKVGIWKLHSVYEGK